MPGIRRFAEPIRSAPVMRSPARVLFVCTANRCRSPLAEAIARQESSGLPISFDSAGLIASGFPMPPVGLRVADELGFELHEHLSRKLDPSDLGEFDLVLTMAREHSRELVAVDPGLWPRVFTVKQFSRWMAGRHWPADERLGPWLAGEAGDRSRAELLGSDPADDVADPLTGPPRAWRKVAQELHTQIGCILGYLYPS